MSAGGEDMQGDLEKVVCGFGVPGALHCSVQKVICCNPDNQNYYIHLH